MLQLALTLLGVALPPASGGFHRSECCSKAHQNGDNFGLEI
jgi:hypothetical protein